MQADFVPNKIEMDKKRNTEVRIAKNSALIVSAYIRIIGWAPITTVLAMMTITENLQFFQQNWHLQVVQMSSICVARFSPAINPFIYAYRIKDVRETVNSIFHSMKRTLSDKEQETDVRKVDEK